MVSSYGRSTTVREKVSPAMLHVKEGRTPGPGEEKDTETRGSQLRERPRPLASEGFTGKKESTGAGGKTGEVSVSKAEDHGEKGEGNQPSQGLEGQVGARRLWSIKGENVQGIQGNSESGGRREGGGEGVEGERVPTRPFRKGAPA